MVSGARKPLALVFALLGRWSVWPVLLPFCGQPSLLAVCRRLTPTCHHWEVVKLGKRKAGQGGSAKPLTQVPACYFGTLSGSIFMKDRLTIGACALHATSTCAFVHLHLQTKYVQLFKGRLSAFQACFLSTYHVPTESHTEEGSKGKICASEHSLHTLFSLILACSYLPFEGK